MDEILTALKKQLPGIEFVKGKTFCWSPAQRVVTYCPAPDSSDTLSLLHEAAHALLGHASYRNDLELLLMEVAAWEKACRLADELGVVFDPEGVQDRLDTYRDWLHQRSTCPRCSTVSLQTAAGEYQCHNCLATWHVSTSRFCRPYRLKNAEIKSRPEVYPQTTFR